MYSYAVKCDNMQVFRHDKKKKKNLNISRFEIFKKKIKDRERARSRDTLMLYHSL